MTGLGKEDEAGSQKVLLSQMEQLKSSQYQLLFQMQMLLTFSFPYSGLNILSLV